jgi:hypothetical protein
MRLVRLLVLTVFTACLIIPAALASGNLVRNGNINGLSGWSQAIDGNINARFELVQSGDGDSSSLKVTVKSSSKGATAGWTFDPVPVSSGTYTYTDSFMSNDWTDVVAHYVFPDWHDDQYVVLGGCMTEFWDEEAPTVWESCSHSLTVPPGAIKVQVIRTINKSNTWLRIDNISLVRN